MAAFVDFTMNVFRFPENYLRPQSKRLAETIEQLAISLTHAAPVIKCSVGVVDCMSCVVRYVVAEPTVYCVCLIILGRFVTGNLLRKIAPVVFSIMYFFITNLSANGKRQGKHQNDNKLCFHGQ